LIEINVTEKANFDGCTMVETKAFKTFQGIANDAGVFQTVLLITANVVT